jgi:3-hydroxymyristoyl/3-hydroxydecanoyl-(acyl carrier protein) dehydratase
MASITMHIAVEHPAFVGHFPGNPLLPGVSLLAEVIEAIRSDPALRERVGPCPRIGIAKFLAPVLPGATLELMLRPTGTRVQFDIRQGDRLTASGHFEAAVAPTAP